MNKKFSTLLAGMALLSVMSVNAQTTPSRVDPETVLGQEWRLGGLKEGANSGLYQLKVGHSLAHTRIWKKRDLCILISQRTQLLV